VEGGVPADADSNANPGGWSIVRTGEITVYVPRGKSYKDDIPRIIYFRKDENEWVGISNEL